MREDYVVPIKIQTKLFDRANVFSENNKQLIKAKCVYIPDARGKFIYLRRLWPDNSLENVGRLTYNGDTENMHFAIFNYSTEKYDSSAIFPGNQYLNGTIEGAMMAGLKAYPV